MLRKFVLHVDVREHSLLLVLTNVFAFHVVDHPLFIQHTNDGLQTVGEQMKINRLSGAARILVTVVIAAVGWSCSQATSEPAAIQLVDRFDDATITNAVEARSDLPRTEWRFDDPAALPEWPGNSK